MPARRSCPRNLQDPIIELLDSSDDDTDTSTPLGDDGGIPVAFSTLLNDGHVDGDTDVTTRQELLSLLNDQNANCEGATPLDDSYAPVWLLFENVFKSITRLLTSNSPETQG